MAARRVAWPDTVKGLAILWIVYFHTFKEFAGNRFPGPLEGGFWQRMCGQAESGVATARCVGRALFIAFSFLGYHGVGVFIVLSGFTLSFALVRQRAARPDWRAWYRSRLLRLFPLYWTAHLIYVISLPPGHRDPIDYRFLLSILGDRVYPLPEMSSYANPAWWYFGLLLELYLVFPVLHHWRERVGAGWFLAGSALVTFASRYVVLFPLGSASSGALLGGALFTCRLFEFTVGMVIGAAYARDRERTERRVLSLPAAALGVALYVAGLYPYGGRLTYVLTDALIGCGLTLFVAYAAVRMERVPLLQTPLALVGFYSYGLYLLHQPYVIWLGAAVHDVTLPTFVVLAGLATVVLTMGSMAVERGVNTVVERALG